VATRSARDIKRRLRSVTNTQKITKALQTVSAVKMRKAQARAIAGREFAEEALYLLRRLETIGTKSHPLLQKKSTGKQLLVLISPDKGLTGSLMANLSRKVSDLIAQQKSVKNRQTDVWAVGMEAAEFARRAGYNVVKATKNEKVTTGIARQLKNELVTAFLDGPYDKVILAYTQFVTTLRQKPFIRGILPLTVEKIIDVEELPERLTTKPALLDPEVYELEPSADTLLTELVPELVTMLIQHALVEAQASEHSARMIAMKNAYDNASELIETLTQTYNRLRQDSITQALAEISAGVSALEKSF
jgi:F-type H+-transporting ATPase subunit gamma